MAAMGLVLECLRYMTDAMVKASEELWEKAPRTIYIECLVSCPSYQADGYSFAMVIIQLSGTRTPRFERSTNCKIRFRWIPGLVQAWDSQKPPYERRSFGTHSFVAVRTYKTHLLRKRTISQPWNAHFGMLWEFGIICMSVADPQLQRWHGLKQGGQQWCTSIYACHMTFGACIWTFWPICREVDFGGKILDLWHPFTCCSHCHFLSPVKAATA